MEFSDMTAKNKANPASTQEKATEAAAETFEKLAAAVQETLDAAIDLGAEAAAEGRETAAGWRNEQLDLAKDGYGKLVAQGKANLEAVTAASETAVAGTEAFMEALGRDTRAQFAENTEYLRKLFAVGTPGEWMELQMEAATKTVEHTVIQATRLGEIAIETAQKSAQPLKARMEETAEAWTRPFVS